MERLLILTGANGGIGLPLLQKAMERNVHCLAVVRRPEILRGIENKCLHISDYAGISSALEILLSQYSFGETRLLLNAFDINPIEKASKLSRQVVEKNLDFNIITQIDLIVACIGLGQKNGSKLSIVQLDSGAAYRPIPGWSLYCSGKAYLNMFLQTVATEEEIPIVLYEPGVVDTNMQNTIRSSREDAFPQVELFRSYKTEARLNDPEKIAQDLLERYVLSWKAESLREKFI